MHDNQYYQTLDQKNYLQAFRRYPVVLAKGRGARVRDVEGNEYLDVLAGIAVNNVGHCHPRVVEAIRKQAGELIHISNFYLSEPQALLSEKLKELSGMDRVFLTNSGAESVEGALKIARKYGHKVGRGGKIIAFEGSFHGRTLATIAMGKAAMQKGFAPIPEGFTRVPFNDLEAVKAAADEQTAGVILEPIQGEGGINPADRSFLEGLRKFCDSEQMVLIFDEIQCGIGRTGRMFAKEHYQVQPDIMSLAKALGGGTPLGAVLSNQKVSDAIEYGDHGTTFGGNPLVCAAALATLRVIEEENLLDEATRKGELLKARIMELNEPSIREVRGTGLMIGIEFDFETKALVTEMFKRKVLANATAGNVLRLLPPLNITDEEIELLIAVLRESLNEIKVHA